jgi:L-alanine-DL-glutamate epimerase-like enolase superfamily enzyme
MTISRKQFLRYMGLGAVGAGAGLITGAAPSRAFGRAAEEAKRLKITAVEIFLFDIPLAEPFRIAIGEMRSAADVLVRVHTDQGVTGIGEACPFPPITGETQATNAAAARSLREMLLGKDPLAWNTVTRGFGALVHSNPSAAAAYDMALFDILGKVAGLPLFRLLGGSRTEFETDITVGIDTPERMAARARKFAAAGYKTIKVKVGLDPDEDVRRLEAVRRAIGGSVRMRIDANQGWTVPVAIYALKKMEKVGVQFVEQPVGARDFEGLKAVRAASPIPVMADESCFLPSDALRLIRDDACDYMNIKLMKAGGIANSVRIAQIADAAGMRCMVGCMIDSRVALTAAAHVVASQENIVFADLDGNSEHVEDPVVDGISVKKGVITLPEKPGLGCDVDPAFLKRLEKV